MIEAIFGIAFLSGLAAGAIRMATPILYAALGELITERSGILNLGVEGTVLMGALCGFLFAAKTGSLWLGLLGGLATGGVMGLVLAVLAASLKVNQSIAGLSLNILASGLSQYLYRVFFPETSMGTLPHVVPFTRVRIPYLADIPVVGEALFNQQLVTYIGFGLVPMLYIFLYRTRWGLELRALGNNPRALDVKGISIPRYQYLSAIFGGMMAGVGGAFLTLAATGMFVPGMSSGRGWIALSIVIFGNWTPVNVMLGSFLFGFLDSLQLQIQGLGIQFPYQLLLAAPYVITVLALLLRRSRSAEPSHLGKPYIRE